MTHVESVCFKSLFCDVLHCHYSVVSDRVRRHNFFAFNNEFCLEATIFLFLAIYHLYLLSLLSSLIQLKCLIILLLFQIYANYQLKCVEVENAF